MDAYAEASRQVFAIFEHYTPLIEPLSIDEAFLEVTGSVRLLGAAPDIARDLRRRIREETSLTASVGVAPNKFLAKLASDLNKPDGLTIIEPDRIQAILDPLPISRLWGVGVKTLARLERMGLAIFADLRRLSEQELRTRFGQAGEHFYRLVRGLDDRPVVPDRRAKSLSHETTFPQDLDHYDHLRSVLLHQAEQVAWRLRRHDLFARNVFIKVRTADFTTATRSRTLPAPTDRTDEFRAAAAELFDTWWHKRSARRRRIRLIGVGLSQLSASGQEQLSLFEAEQTARSRSLDRTLDRIRERFGTDAVSRGGRPDDA
jgi:DNA polymerase-4